MWRHRERPCTMMAREWEECITPANRRHPGESSRSVADRLRHMRWSWNECARHDSSAITTQAQMCPSRCLCASLLLRCACVCPERIRPDFAHASAACFSI
jgi:hypothetical protein